MDAGKKEVIIVSDTLFKPRKFAIMLPNILFDINKVFLEKYFLWKLETDILSCHRIQNSLIYKSSPKNWWGFFDYK
jgi:hypothetical protein